MLGLSIDSKIAFRNLLEHGRRSLLLAAAIAAVTSLFVLLTSLALGIRQTLVETATTITSGDLNVGGFYKPTVGQVAPVVSDAAKLREDVAAVLPELEFAVERGHGFAKVVGERASLLRGINGVDIEREVDLKRVLQIESGNIDDLAQPNTLLIFEGQAKKLKLRVGDVVTLSAQTSRGVTNTLDCRVVAIAREIGLLSSWNVFVPNETVRALFQLAPDVTGVVMVHLAAAQRGDLEASAERLRTGLASKGYVLMPPDARPFWQKLERLAHEDWTGQRLDVTTWEDELSFLMWTLQTLHGLSAALIGVLVAILIAGVMNTLWIAIRERTREIGTLRAIGMQRRQIARLFLLEATMLGAFGATAGSVLGGLCALGLNLAQLQVPVTVQLFLMRDTLRFAIEPGVLASGVGLLTAVTGFAALFPSVRASRLQPVDAMAHFG